MSDELYQYYEQELIFFRQMAGEFAKRYPKVASRLQLDETKETADPHVERLIEAFALLTGRIRRKIDDEFPEIVESLLQILYPHYLRPLPPVAIAQFRFDPGQTAITEPSAIPSGSTLTSRPAAGQECTFRTVYPVTVWPIKITGASLGPVASVQATGVPSDASYALRIQLETIGTVPPGSLKIPFLRFFLNGDGTPVHLLYELLFAHALRVQIRPRGAGKNVEPVVLPADSIRAVGFDREEALLAYSDLSFTGYRLLHEYFHFPDKFLFFDLAGFDPAALDPFGNAFEILIFFRDSELRNYMPSIAQAVSADTFQLGCAPIVNLFERTAETIRISHAATEYRVVPDRHHQTSMEVYSIDQVVSTASYEEEPRVYQPFYSFRHAYGDQQPDCFWYAHRRPSLRKDDEGTEVYLSLVNLDFKPANPPSELLTPRVTCTNRDFVSRISWRKEWGEISGEGLPLVQGRCIVPPTRTLRPPLRGGLQWRLISHLSLNHLSITQSGGLEALQEILHLYTYSEDEDARKRITGIVGMKSESSVSRVLFDTGVTFCRGLDIEMEFDEEQFAGSGVYLLASVLERFLGLYSSINSYSRLTARTRQRPGILKRWPVRAGALKVL